MLQIILLTITLIILILATIVDIKTREIPDYLTHSLIYIAVTLNILHSIIFKNNNYITILITLLILIIIANILYYTKFWGGGDSKLIIGLSLVFLTYPQFLLIYLNPSLPYPFLLTFFINLLLISFIYGLIYAITLTVINFKNFKKEFKKLLPKYTTLRLITIILTVLILITFYITKIPPLIILAFLSFLYPYIIIFTKATENSSLIKSVPPKKITEGDLLAENINYNNKIYSKKSLGLTNQQIKQLIKRNKPVLIKYGIPFAPVFLIATIISLIFGNIIF